MGEHHTLVIRFSSLGDIVLAGAVTGSIAPVTFLTLPRWREVAAALPGVERVLCWGIDPVPRTGWAQVVDLHASPRSYRVRVDGPVHRARRHDLRRRLRVWAKLGAPPPPVVSRYADAAGTTAVPPPWVSRPALPRETLLLCPGASAPTKRWPVDHFAALAARWEGPVLALGSRAEAPLCQRVGVESIAEDGFARTLAALGRGAACVGGDTGLTHLAAAAGIPTVVLFGPTTREDGFWPHAEHSVQAPLACRPCSLHGSDRCPVGDHLCMEAIEVDAVWRALVGATRTPSRE